MTLDHITIRTHRLTELRDFMIEIFGLVDGPRPATIIASVNGHWLYHGDWPLVHLIQSNVEKGQRQKSAEALDHFAFVMNNYEAFRQKLTDKKIPFEMMDIPEMNRKRIFLHAPNGVLIETIFEDR